MTQFASRLRKVRLQTLLFAFLALFGILPIIVNSVIAISRSRAFYEREEKVDLSRQAEELSERFGSLLRSADRQLELVGAGIEAIPTSLDAVARERWLQEQMGNFVGGSSLDFFPYVVELGDGGERAYRANDVPDEIHRAALVVIDQAKQGQLPRYSFVSSARSTGHGPWVLVARTQGGQVGSSQLQFVLLAAVEVPLRDSGDEEIYLLDRERRTVMWSSGSGSELADLAVERSPEIRSALDMIGGFPVLEYDLRVGSSVRRMIGQLSALGTTGWTALVQKRETAALASAGTMVRGAALAAALTVFLALIVGALASRLISQPIQALATTSREIASGRFDQRVEIAGFGREFQELAQSFNVMGDQVEEHVAKLRTAARENRELFIGTIRAMLRAVEAKEPYTRGHSERVASYSQAISRRLNQSRDFQDEIWIAALLHDVGKIGVEDRVLNKGDALTSSEFEEMKRHPVIGAEIMSSIQALHPQLPAIRWHHERWGGGGYPDGLSGKEIPLMARVVAVADTFDAVTTQRVYQDPCTPEEAVSIIRQLDGINFDPEVVAAFLAAFEGGDLAVVPGQRKDKPTRQIGEFQPVHS